MWRWILAGIWCYTAGLASVSGQSTTQPVTGNHILRVATCQFEVTADVKANANWIRRQMQMARGQGAQVAHFCECALSGYPGADFSSMANYDWSLLNREAQSILNLARELKIWVILGSMHRLSAGHKPHDCLYVVNPQGGIVDRYDKRFCTRSDLKYFSPGDHFVVFDIHGIQCGLLICFDLGYPELFRQYARLQAQVIFHSFYNARGTSHYRERARMTLALGAAQATMNYFYMSLSNTSGPLGWGSFVVAPDAEILTTLKNGEPDVAVTTIDTSQNRYDFTLAFREKALSGALNSGETIHDDRSLDRTTY